MAFLRCGICVEQCPKEAVTVTGNLARMDYGMCNSRGKCAEKRPAHAAALSK